MKNCVTVQIFYSYQGVDYSPSAVIDFDYYLGKNIQIPPLFHLVASQNDIDIYSYQYEVMEIGQFKYFDAQGLAKEFCHEDSFDVASFQQKWKQADIINRLNAIARQYLSIEDLNKNDSIKTALLAAYQLGRESS